MASPKLPSTVTHILIQPVCEPEEMGNLSHWAWMIHDLKLMVEKDSRIFLLPARDEHVIESVEIEKNWIDRIGGGEGCWDMSESNQTGEFFHHFSIRYPFLTEPSLAILERVDSLLWTIYPEYSRLVPEVRGANGQQM
jgi:hypothetical protein